MANEVNDFSPENVAPDDVLSRPTSTSVVNSRDIEDKDPQIARIHAGICRLSMRFKNISYSEVAAIHATSMSDLSKRYLDEARLSDGDRNRPTISQSQQDLNNLKERVDSDQSLYQLQDVDRPEDPVEPETIISSTDSQPTTSDHEAKDLSANEEKTRRMKHLQDHLWQDLRWFLWQKNKEFAAGIWEVLTAME